MAGEKYIEGFLERDGYRHRFYAPDGPGLVNIEYQEYVKGEGWKARPNVEIGFLADDVPAVCDLLKQLSEKG